MRYSDIVETEESDSDLRDEARAASIIFGEWIKDNIDKIKSKLQPMNNKQGYKITAFKTGLPYRDLNLYIQIGKMGGAYGSIRGDNDTKIIVLKILEDLADIVNLDVIYHSRGGKIIFTHEMIHYLDDQKNNYITGKNKSASDLTKNGVFDWSGYMNSPDEYNAYYNQAVAALEDKLDELEGEIDSGRYSYYKDKISAMNAQEFVKWIKTPGPDNDFMDYDFIKFLNKNYTQKLNKRLARYFNEKLKKRFESIQEASRIGTGVRKNEIPEKYKKYPLINRGTTSAILEIGPEEVLMLTKDPIKKDWLIHELDIAELIDAYDSRHPKLGTMTTYVLKMPRLYPLSKENRKLARDLEELLRRMNREAHEMNQGLDIKTLRGMSRKQVMHSYKENIIRAFWEYFENEYDEVTNGDHKLRKLIDFLANYDPNQYEWDMRQGNFMQTKDGELVILDPVIDKEILNTFRGG
jgi:hypothetical protein